MPPVETQNPRVTNFVRITSEDWRAFAMYARAAAYQAEKDAEVQTNPQVRKSFLDQAKAAKERAEKAENAARVL